MDAARGRPGSCGSSWKHAEQLAMEIAAGGRLPELASPVLLEDGEVLHASGDVEAWRFQGIDVPYVHHRGFAVGGLFTFWLTAAATAAATPPSSRTSTGAARAHTAWASTACT